MTEDFSWTVTGTTKWSKAYRGKQAVVTEPMRPLFAHRTRARETIAEWTRALKLLNRKIDFYDEWLTTGQRPREKPRVTARRGGASRAQRRAIYSRKTK